MYTESLYFLDSVRSSSDDCRFAKDRIFNSIYLVPFWNLIYLNWHSWLFVFVSTDNDWDNCSGFTPTASFHTHPLMWLSYNSKFWLIRDMQTQLNKWRAVLSFGDIYLFSKSTKIYRKHENIWLWYHCPLSTPLVLTRLWHRLDTKLHHNSDNREPWKPVAVTSLLHYLSTNTGYFTRNKIK